MKCSVLSVLKITRVKNALLHYLTYLCNSSCIQRHCKRQSLIKVSRNILVRSKKSYVVIKHGHSTVHPMMLLLNKLKAPLNEKKHSIVIFCDLKKAFDTCDHDILLQKMFNIGIHNTELAWFSNYLKDRLQYVYINNASSS